MPSTAIRNNSYGILMSTNTSGVIVNNSPSLNPTDYFALEISALLHRGIGCILVDNSSNGTMNSYFLSWDGISLAFYSTIGGIARNITNIRSPAFRLDDHNDISVFYNGAKIIVMANGVYITALTVTGALGTNSGDLRIGQYYNGAVASRTVLSAYRFYHTDQYTAKSHRMRVFENKEDPAITGTCMLNLGMVGSGTTVPDLSGNGNNGTVSGTTWTTNVPGKARATASARTPKTTWTPATRTVKPNREGIFGKLYVKMFLDSDTLPKNIANASALTAWPDCSGRGSVPNSTGASRPTFYKTTTAELCNGKPAVSWNGTTQLLTTTLNVLGPPFTVFMVARTDADSFNQYFMDGNVFNQLVMYRLSGALRIYAGINVGPIAMPNATWSLLSATYNGAGSFVGLGSTEVSGNSGALTAQGITLGNSAGGGAGTGLNGNIALVIVADGTYSAAVRTEMRNEIVKMYPNLTL
jgi:hypothetical protein